MVPIFIIQNPRAVYIGFLGAYLWLLLGVALLLAAVGAAHAGRPVNLAAPPHRRMPIAVLEFSTLAQRQLIEQEIAELNAPRPGQPPDTPSEAWPSDLCPAGLVSRGTCLELRERDPPAQLRRLHTHDVTTARKPDEHLSGIRLCRVIAHQE